MLFKSPNGDMIIRMSIIGFVDDSTCTTGGDPEKPIEDLIGTTHNYGMTYYGVRVGNSNFQNADTM